MLVTQEKEKNKKESKEERGPREEGPKRTKRGGQERWGQVDRQSQGGALTKWQGSMRIRSLGRGSPGAGVQGRV